MIFETKPTIIGHRGFGSGTRDGYRENTLESYLAAVAHGLSWVELDVRRSLDGELVIWHDPVAADGELIARQRRQHAVRHGERHGAQLGFTLAPKAVDGFGDPRDQGGSLGGGHLKPSRPSLLQRRLNLGLSLQTQRRNLGSGVGTQTQRVLFGFRHDGTCVVVRPQTRPPDDEGGLCAC